MELRHLYSIVFIIGYAAADHLSAGRNIDHRLGEISCQADIDS